MAVSLCRECEVVLWRRHEACPRCRARRPDLRGRAAVHASPASAARVVRRVALGAATAPAALAADDVLRRLVG